MDCAACVADLQEDADADEDDDAEDAEKEDLDVFKVQVQVRCTCAFRAAWLRLLELKDDLKQLDLDTLLGDATFVPAKKRAMTSDRQSPAKAPRLSC